jgi:glutamate-5-semialdehyde dehydrogenase
MTVMQEIRTKGELARKAARVLSTLNAAIKNEALLAIARALEERQEAILAANARDMAAGREKGLSRALLDRLLLNDKRIQDMAASVRALVALPDPVGEITSMWTQPNGLQIGRVRVPLGVVGIIYEARPNVTVDAACLCLKTGNAIILRGGSEAFHSNLALTQVISQAAVAAGVPQGAIQLIATTDREAANALMQANDYLDVLIPRGGAGLIRTVVAKATVPVIETGVGNCHVYVDADADLKMARSIVINAKTQRPGVCNAMETLLVHEKVAAELLPALAVALQEKGVTLRGCERTQALLPGVQPATEDDWRTEYLDLVLAIRIVDSLEAALEHIHAYGSKHSEAIVTQNYQRARDFLAQVDAAAVYVNASTRFTDGFEYGFGAEIGISTQKLHARGPMGPEQLTTFKYIIFGSGQIR